MLSNSSFAVRPQHSWSPEHRRTGEVEQIVVALAEHVREFGTADVMRIGAGHDIALTSGPDPRSCPFAICLRWTRMQAYHDKLSSNRLLARALTAQPRSTAASETKLHPLPPLDPRKDGPLITAFNQRCRPRPGAWTVVGSTARARARGPRTPERHRTPAPRIDVITCVGQRVREHGQLAPIGRVTFGHLFENGLVVAGLSRQPSLDSELSPPPWRVAYQPAFRSPTTVVVHQPRSSRSVAETGADGPGADTPLIWTIRLSRSSFRRALLRFSTIHTINNQNAGPAQGPPTTTTPNPPSITRRKALPLNTFRSKGIGAERT
ncbi:hypothetical protein ACWDOP_11195 [Nocardia sp. NPDC003693]